jgi:hypothetical protein
MEGVLKPVGRLRLAGAVGVATLLGVTACTFLLDRKSAQCQTNADCRDFPGRPICGPNSICTWSGLQADYCFQDSPQTDDEFFNRCTTNWLPGPEPGKCLSFDNCERFGLCSNGGAGDGADGGTGLTPPAPPNAGPPSDGGASPPPPLPNCQDPSAGRGSVIYLSGSSNFVALLGKLAPLITMHTDSRLVPVFRQTDSCTGARSMYRDNPTRTADHFIRDPAPGPTAIYAQYFDADGAHNCLLGSAGAEVDVGEAEIAAETCGLQPPDPAFVRHTPGPILPILFVVPRGSIETAISAEAARQVFGNGKNGNVSPWIEPSLVFIRGAGTATTRLIGLAIDLRVPPNRFWGIDPGSAQKLDANLRLITGTDAQKAIGLLGSDTYDTDRGGLKALAFKAKDQECVFLPDSDLFTKDKINVRDGHYPIWGRLHFFTTVGEGGSLVSDAASEFISLFSQTQLPLDVLDAFINASWVPECAMKVQRETEMGPLVTNHPPAFPCGCHFDALVTGKIPDGCTECITNEDCTDPARPSCNFTFCESR